MFDILGESKNQMAYAVKMRRYFHCNPERSSKEFHTIQTIASELTRMKIPFVNIPDGGILATIEAGKNEKTVLLRADCDALAIQELPENGSRPRECISQVANVAHMCGHDSHMSMLLAAAEILKKHEKDLNGRVLILFERGEEGGNCIYYVKKYIDEQKVKIDGCYAIHVEPSLKTGTMCIQGGPSHAGNNNFEITLVGKGGHGSRPDLSNNPIDCFIAIGNAMKDLRMKYIAPADALTYNIGSVQSGLQRNIIPESLTFLGTTRFYRSEAGKSFKEHLKKVVDCNAECYGCQVQYNVFSGPSLPVINNDVCAEIGREMAAKIFGAGCLVSQEPSMGSESFATLAAYYPSLMIRLGIRNEEKGTTAGLHNPHFDLDEEAMVYGIATHVGYALAFLEDRREIAFTPFPGDADDLLRYTDRPVPTRFDTKE